MWFKHSGINAKTIDDIKLQVQGDYNRFQDARTLALRMSPTHGHAAGEDTTSFWTEKDDWSWYDDMERYYHAGDADHDGEWFWDCDEEGEGHYFEDYDSYDYTDPNYEYYQEDYDDGGWYWEQQEPWPSGEQPVETTSEESKKTSDETAGESFFKGKGKGKHDGCFICGSKWHMARDCPMQGTSKGKGKTKSPSEHHLAASHYKGKGKGKFGGGWRWRPRPKGSGYKGSGYRGYGGYGSKGKGKGKGYRHHWFTDASKTLTFLDGSDPSHREADKATPTPVERYTIHTDSEEDLRKTTRTRQVSQADDDPKSDKLNKSKNITLNFTTFHTEKLEVYHQVRGRERHGLLIDPGAASGLACCSHT